MLSNPEYSDYWEAKNKIYEANGFSEANGNLIVTVDYEDGSVDSQIIQEKNSWLIA